MCIIISTFVCLLVLYLRLMSYTIDACYYVCLLAYYLRLSYAIDMSFIIFLFACLYAVIRLTCAIDSCSLVKTLNNKLSTDLC